MVIIQNVGLFDDKEIKDTIERRIKELKRQPPVELKPQNPPSLIHRVLNKLRQTKPKKEEIKTELDEWDLYCIVIDSNSYEDLSDSFYIESKRVLDFIILFKTEYSHLFRSNYRGVKEARYIEDLLGYGMFPELNPKLIKLGHHPIKWIGSFGIKQPGRRITYISSENIRKHGKKLISLLRFDLRKARAKIPKEQHILHELPVEYLEPFRDDLIKIIELAQSKKKGIVLMMFQ